MSAPDLLAELAVAQRYGWIGQGPLDHQIAHSLAFGEAVALLGTDVAVDLGAGGGLPGLVLAVLGPPATWHLVDTQLDRADFLHAAVQSLDLTERVTVHHVRAEDFGRSDYRGTASVVTARSFGRPAAVAENAAPLLCVGGRLVVSEPPDSGHRWPEEALVLLGLSPATPMTLDGIRFVRMTQEQVCAERFPRRVKPQRTNPLF